MRTVANYAVFKLWADTLPADPLPLDVRRQFGCSSTTANDWINRWQGQRLAGVYGRELMATDRVFRALVAAGDPLTVRAVAEHTGLGVTAVIHAMANLFEANRVLRFGQTKPFSYGVPSAMPNLDLMPAPLTRSAPLVASLGVPMAPTYLLRIAA
jgi:hypothetical protein